ncbi:MAG: iron complex outermembrane receptor protein [Candidatus Azotimanducaceae bacterium]|jgi:outer membrane receptor protein involved in Fe transport
MAIYKRLSSRTQILASAITLAALSSVGVQAQDSGSSKYTMEEVVVTATKRSQTLQSTPIAVSVTGQETFKKARLLDIADLQSVVPSLRVNTLQTSSNTNFIIRGFGNGANNAGIEPSVGVFIDGVYRSRSAAAIGDLPRLQRVEVLRGPQSTLFGKNASAGVISVVTEAPSYETEARIEVQAGNYDQRLVKGYFSGGLTDTLSASISGGINMRDGFVESTNGLEDMNDRDRWNVRGQALWEATDNMTFRLIADYSELDELCCAVTNLANGPTAGIISGVLGGEVLDDSDPFAYISPVNLLPINKVEDRGISLQADIDFDSFVLTSITAYRRNDSLNDSEADYTGAEILDSAFNEANIKTFTQEIRLTSTGTGKIDWMLGGFFFDEDIDQVQGLKYGNDTRPYIDALAGGLLPTLETLTGQVPGSFFSADTITRESFTQANEAFSLFATVDFHVSEKMTITGGLNYTNDDKTVTGSTVNGDVYSSIDLFTVNNGLLPQAFFAQGFTGVTGLAPTPANIAATEAAAPGTTAAIQSGANANITGLQALQFQPQFLAFPNEVQSGESSVDQVTWTARVTYEINNNINVYASAATGFKANSWNLSRDARPFFANRAALEAAGLTQVNQSYGTLFADPEEALVYEIGLKARFDRGAINLAVFDQSIDGFQSNIFSGTGFGLANAGEQSTTGFEVDANWTPIDSLTLTFAGTFLDPVYDSFVNGPGPGGTVVDLSGQQPAGISEISIVTSATYNHDFDSGAYGYVRGDYLYESDVQTNEAIPGIRRQVNTVNASMGLDFDNGLGIQVFARNLFNDEYITTAFPGVIQAGTVNGYVNPPRIWGASVTYDFF